MKSRQKREGSRVRRTMKTRKGNAFQVERGHRRFSTESARTVSLVNRMKFSRVRRRSVFRGGGKEKRREKNSELKRRV